MAPSGRKRPGRRRLKIEIQVEHAAWRAAWPRLRADARAVVEAALACDELAGVSTAGSFALVLSDDPRLAALNLQFRGKDKPTNVLSFPDDDLPPGGIAVAFETIMREAKAQGKTFVNHAKHMILHGFLHLHGFDHIKMHEARLMEGLETAILGGMGIPNPYASRSSRRD